MHATQPPQPTAQATVMLFDEHGDVKSSPVAPANDDLYDSLTKLTGYKILEPWNFILSREDTKLIVAVYCNEEGRLDKSPLNLHVSQALGVELFGKAVLVCFEEFDGDDDGEGEWSAVISHERLLEKLDERGESLSVARDKRFPGRLGDLMHELRNMLSNK